MMNLKTISTLCAAFSLAAAAFGETWKDSKGVTWEFSTMYSGGIQEATIKGATPAPQGVLTIPGTVSDGGIPCTVTKIGIDAFSQNKGITGVVIPASVTNISFCAFEQCPNLKSVTFKGAPPECDIGNSFWATPFYDGVLSRQANCDMSTPTKVSGLSGAAKDDNFLAVDSLATGAKAVKWYEWTAPASGTVWFWTQGNNFNTFLGACASGTTDDIAHNDDFAGSASQIAFPVTMGTKYAVYVGGADPNYLGEYTLKWRMGTPVSVVFDPCGGSMDVGFGGNVAPYPKNVAAGTLPTPTRKYYNFAGWYTKKSGGTKVTASKKFAKGTKLYAHWAKKKYKVILVKEEGGKSVKGAGTYAWGTKVKLSAVAKPGYVLRAWGSEIGGTYYDASSSAFPKYNTQRRKNATPTITVPKGSHVSYYASFVKKSKDTISMQVTKGSTTLYAEDGSFAVVDLEVDSVSYPKVTTSKLPAGVKFSLIPAPFHSYMGVVYDTEYRLQVVNSDKVPEGRHVVKVTAKNRSGKTATKTITIWGRNKNQASQNGALNVGDGRYVQYPIEIYAGTKCSLAGMGVSAASGWKIASVTGLPSGITWDAKARKLKGVATKTGRYTLVLKVSKGKTVYTETLTLRVMGLPARLVGKLSGYASPNEFDGFFNGAARTVTVSLTSAGKVSAKVGGASFSCSGLTYDQDNNKFHASMKSSVAKSKTLTYTRTLDIELDPAADFYENSLGGVYYEYTTKKTAHSISEELVAHCDIVGRRNVFDRDGNGNLLFEDAGFVQDALNMAIADHQASVIPIPEAEGSVTVTLNAKGNGVATLAGTMNGQPFSESAVVWFEYGKGNVFYLRILSFRLGSIITYMATVDNWYDMSIQAVSAPSLPFG